MAYHHGRHPRINACTHLEFLSYTHDTLPISSYPEEKAQAAAAARATAADTSIITHGGAGWARRSAGHRTGEGRGRVNDGTEKEREGERER